MLEPRFLNLSNGRIHLAVFVPAPSVDYRGLVLHFPAFGEEMNKSRATVSRQARNLAAAGFRVVVPDYHGTGDSEGDFGNSDWASWRSDVEDLLSWLVDQGESSAIFWGLRTGCLMALQSIHVSSIKVGALLLWQPCGDGEIFCKQFLRLGFASGLLGDRSETTSELRERLRRGERIEVAGYELSPSLISQLEQVQAKALYPGPGIPTHWLEVVSAPSKGPSPVATKTLSAWREQGADALAHTVVGPQFWLTQEITFADDLLEKTSQLLADIPPTGHLPPNWQLPTGVKFGEGDETALTFDCGSSELAAVIHRATGASDLGVVLVVGGPQYRVGSHRQFVDVARAVAAAGVPVLRFDYRGMGDSGGELRGFEFVREDIAAAINALQVREPGIQRVVIWGLCDAATAATFYAWRDPRVAGLILINPWARSEQGEAKAYLKQYYLRRMLSRAFWRKLCSGEYNIRDSLKSLSGKLRLAFSGEEPKREVAPGESHQTAPRHRGLVERIYHGLECFSGPILLILSGDDLTAREFRDGFRQSRKLRRSMGAARIEHRHLGGADHTFSTKLWRSQVIAWTVDWLARLPR